MSDFTTLLTALQEDATGLARGTLLCRVSGTVRGQSPGTSAGACEVGQVSTAKSQCSVKSSQGPNNSGKRGTQIGISAYVAHTFHCLRQSSTPQRIFGTQSTTSRARRSLPTGRCANRRHGLPSAVLWADSVPRCLREANRVLRRQGSPAPFYRSLREATGCSDSPDGPAPELTQAGSGMTL